MLIGCVADDFTGASDIANTLAREGLRTMLSIGVPASADATSAEADAVVVALKTRSIEPSEAVTRSLAALEWLRGRGCGRFIFKYCSTFDSSPQGNIGPVAQAMAEALGAPGVVVCPAFPATGRTVYQGHLFVHDRLLSESGMQNHPLNPMTDSDIRRWLRPQTSLAVGHVAHHKVRAGPEALAEALAAAAVDFGLVVVDAVCDDDLRVLGRACIDAPLVTGGSGVGMGLASALRERGQVHAGQSGFSGRNGPAAILAGSCSSATLGQIAQHGERNPVFRVDPAELMVDAGLVGKALDFLQQNASGAPLVTSSVSPEELQRAQADHDPARLAAAIERFFGELAVGFVARGGARLVIAGGETSGAVVSALGLSAVEIGPEIDPGVPALACEAPPLVLALKSGNFGRPDFFERALGILGGGT